MRGIFFGTSKERRKEAIQTHFRFHDLRHTFASHFVMNGGSLCDLQKLLGHARFEETQRYAHLTPEHLAKAINIVSFDGPNAPAPAQKLVPEVRPTAPKKQPAAQVTVEEVPPQVAKAAVPF